MIDRRFFIKGNQLPDGTEEAEPFILDADGKQIAFQRVALAMVSRAVLQEIVGEITQNVTRNVIVNFCARLKDRCQHESQTRKGKCGISRAAHHVNDHDFTEAPAPTAEEIRKMTKEAAK